METGLMSELEGGITEEMASPNSYNLTEETADQDWESALKELEQLEARQSSARKLAANGKVVPPPAPKVVAEEPAPEPEPVDLNSPQVIVDRYTDILSAINTSMNQLSKFEERHPYLIAPNIYRVMEDGLKESSLVMFREFHRLRERLRNETGEEV